MALVPQRPSIALLVVDLDNTLYDWVSFFTPAFYAMVETAAAILGVDEERLLDDLQAVHRHHGDTEHPFALLETTIVGERLRHMTVRERRAALDDAFHAFNHARNRTLALYPSVEPTLRHISSRGTTIVAHTEASVGNALFRLRKLKVDDTFAKLYAPAHLQESHPDLAQLPEETLRARVRMLRRDERKPDPRVIADIRADFGAAAEQTLYVGDSIARDIGMARAAGVWSAWAKYGTQYDAQWWPKLVRVTHWTDDDVLRARRTDERFGSAVPDFTLDREFGQLLDVADFAPTAGSATARELARGS